jgi:hypothetical protein
VREKLATSAHSREKNTRPPPLEFSALAPNQAGIILYYFWTRVCIRKANFGSRKSLKNYELYRAGD